MTRWALRVRGQVQGVGFRPFVLRTARASALTGWVRNDPDGVRIEAQGDDGALQALEGALRGAWPPIVVDGIERTELTAIDAEPAFRIVASGLDAAPRPSVPPDLATCPACLADLDDPVDRRFDYPLVSCTACGPRYTIARALPFDRDRTEMAAFPLCPACHDEYTDPTDRRFHAQATVCAACGPTVRGLDVAASALQAGGIVALKGLGGYQLLCDARDDEAVGRLRSGKRRPDRPLAVMFRDATQLRAHHLEPTPTELGQLMSPAAPIVLLQPTGPTGLSPEVGRGVRRVGAMLPTTGLHHLWMRRVEMPLVCTSGNVSGDPLCADEAHARAELGSIADAFVDHDRPIRHPADDSVVRVVIGESVVLRRGRGLAPAPIPLSADGPVVLAAGAHLDSTIGLAIASEAVVSPHIGDLGGRRMQQRFEQVVSQLLEMYACEPERVVCDRHPDYASSHFAAALAEQLGAELLPVQHHRAHVASVLAEHGHEGPALGLAWDGTGLGDDDTIWGAEAFDVRDATMTRIATLTPFRLPGGDACARSPARCALGLLAAYGEVPDALADAAARVLPDGSVPTLLRMAERGVNAPVASSMGRLFDAVAFLADPQGTPAACTWSGQAATHLEQLAESAAPVEPFSMPWVDDLLDWRPLIAELLAERDGPAVIAARFHRALTTAIVGLAQQVGHGAVVLSGGCFANGVLLGSTTAALEDAGFTVLSARQLPPGDGGLALGQLWLGRHGGR